MRKIPRRDKLKIYGDLLSIIYNEASSEKIILSRIQVKANVPFDRLKNYISEIEALGLIQQEPRLRLTEKGREYLMEYEKVLEFMKRMGLTY
jgi:predicted transcriptional regulator